MEMQLSTKSSRSLLTRPLLALHLLLTLLHSLQAKHQMQTPLTALLHRSGPSSHLSSSSASLRSQSLERRRGFGHRRLGAPLRPLRLRSRITALPWPERDGVQLGPEVDFHRQPSRRVTWAGDSDSIDLSTLGSPRRPASQHLLRRPTSSWPSWPLPLSTWSFFSGQKTLMNPLGVQLTPSRRRVTPPKTHPWRRQPPRPPSVAERIAHWFEGFKPPADFLRVRDKERKRKKSAKKPDRIQGVSSTSSLDYTDFQIGNDHNLIFHDNPTESVAEESQYDFGDVFDSLQRNETQTETLRKFLSAASALSDRSSSSPAFMLWTVPTTIFATLGVVYFLAAAAILSYQALVGNGDQVAMGPTVLALSLPAAFAFALVTARASYKGELNIKRAMGNGGYRSVMRPDFDGVDFTLDAMFGSAAILGIGWIASITL